MASTMTGVLRAKQTSWRPGTERSVMEPSEMSYVLWAFLMLEVGLNATLNLSGPPLVMPRRHLGREESPRDGLPVTYDEGIPVICDVRWDIVAAVHCLKLR